MEWISALIAFVVAGILGLVPAHMEAFQAPQPQPQATILFGGDMMFDRSIRTTIEEKGGNHVFSCITDVLRNVDMVVANLEGPITSTSSKSVGSAVGGEGNYTFTFPPSTAALLYEHNIRLVNIGNNHIMNFGRWGLEETKLHLDEAGVGYFGDPDADEAGRVARLEIHGIPFSFVNWSDWPARPGTSDKTDHTVAQVRNEAQGGRVVVVYTHWGEEYVPATERTKVLARQFIDAGAAIVIGGHPHVVQEHEVYAGKDIYYSLGNFIFDQYWEESVRQGLLLRIVFTRTGVSSVQEIPIEFGRDRRSCLLQ